MKYTILLNQPLMIEHKLNVSKWAIIEVLSVAPAWAKPIIKDDELYFWVARTKISEELKAFDLKPDTVFRYLKELREKEFINYIKDGKKDLVRLTPKGKKLISSTMSEKIPDYYVGKNSESTMSEKIPAYKTTFNKTTIIKTPPLLVSLLKESQEYEQYSEIVKDFIEYRKSIKKSINTTLPIKSYIKALQVLQEKGLTFEYCINKMKEREWQTLKEDYFSKEIEEQRKESEDYFSGWH